MRSSGNIQSIKPGNLVSVSPDQISHGRNNQDVTHQVALFLGWVQPEWYSRCLDDHLDRSFDASSFEFEIDDPLAAISREKQEMQEDELELVGRILIDGHVYLVTQDEITPLSGDETN